VVVLPFDSRAYARAVCTAIDANCTVAPCLVYRPPDTASRSGVDSRRFVLSMLYCSAYHNCEISEYGINALAKSDFGDA
jgi:hypothetical protein